MSPIKTAYKFLLPTLLAFIIFYLALNVHWSDSELWALGLARNTLSSLQASTDYKILFNLLLNLSYAPDLGNLQTVHLARIIFALVGLGIAGMVYATTSLLTQNKKAALWTTFLFVSCTLFLSQSFKLRSDILASLIQITSLFHYLWFRQKRSPHSLHPYLGLLLNLLMLLSTPKAVMLLLVNFSFIFFFEKDKPRAEKLKFIKTAFVYPSIAFLLLMTWKREQFMTALDFFISSFSQNEHHPAAWSQESFKFVATSIINNSHLLFLALTSLLFIPKITRSAQNKALLAAASTSILLVLLHNDRLPFFLFSLSTMPILLLGVISYEGISKLLSKRFVKILFISTALFAATNAIVFTHKMLRDGTNQNQILAQKELEIYLSRHPGIVYFDGTIVLPKENRIYVFPAPNQYGNKEEVLGVLSQENLSLVFLSNRMFFYMNDIFHSLEDRFFIQIGNGIFAKSHAVRSTHKLTSEEWQSVCSRFGNPEKIYAYEGSNFANMKVLASKPVWSCAEQNLEIVSQEPFVAFSAFEPVHLPEGKSFAEIFDHNPLY